MMAIKANDPKGTWKLVLYIGMSRQTKIQFSALKMHETWRKTFPVGLLCSLGK